MNKINTWLSQLKQRWLGDRHHAHDADEAERDRAVRVFVSSTFRDMVEDRNALMAQTWPALRKLCRERSVEFVEVDLRWGITEEMSQRAETLRHCLAEIKRCRPYFIGLLGERYGWTPGPEAYPEALLHEEPWLQDEVAKHSVTELEILHGVLNDPAMAGRAFFYIRDPAYAEQKGADYQREDEVNAQRQRALKDHIRTVCLNQHIPLREGEDYRDPDTLSKRVLADLTAAIEAEFPADRVPDVWAREARDHEAYAKSRRTRFYVGRDGYFDRLDAHGLNGADGQGLLVLGDSGGGKSALLANWVDRWRQAHPEDFVFQHYLGASPMSAGHLALLRRLMVAIIRWCRDDTATASAFDAEEERLPVKAEDIVKALPEYLSRLDYHCRQHSHRAVILLDALNQIEDSEQGLRLVWLPYRMPDTIRLVVATLPGDTLDALNDRHWPTLTVEPLCPEERTRLIAGYLAHFSQALSDQRAQRIAQVPAAANPLYLKTLLDDLRATGAHDRLDQQIDDYLQATDIPTLFGKILERYEQDYQRDRPHLVRDALSLLWAARRGLTESELLELLKPDKEPQLATAYWSPIRCALAEGLLDRDGILAFGHDYLRQAVGQRYLPNLDTQDDTRLQLADYFAVQPVTVRSCDELPWLLAETERHDRLRECLLDIERFLLIRERDQNELMRYWVAMGLEREMGAPYRERFERWERTLRPEPLRSSSVALQLGYFLSHAGLYAAAGPLFRRALAGCEQALEPAHPATLTSVNNLASLLQDQGDYAAAEPLYRRALVGCEQALGPNHPDTLQSVNNLAELLRAKGDTAAEPLHRRALAGREQALGPDHPDTLASVNNLALLLQAQGDHAAAEPLYRRALAGQEKALGPNHPDTLTSVNNLAFLLNAQGDYAAAEPLCRRALAGQEKALGPNHPDTLLSVNNLAELLQAQGDNAAAEPLYRRALAGYEQALGPDHPDTLLSVNNLAALLEAQGDYAAAEPLHRRALAGREQALGPTHPDTCKTLQNLISLLEKAGRTDEAKTLHAVYIDRVASNPNVSPLALRQLALECFNLGDYARTEALLRQVLAKGFEIPGTNCHLTRALILAGREAEAEVAVDEAWTHRVEAPPYVVGRILWFQVAFALLDGVSPAPFLGRLKTALQAEGAHMEWTMDPVLAQLQPKLSPEAHALLTALVAALGDPANLAKLDDYPEWRAAAALPLA